MIEVWGGEKHGCPIKWGYFNGSDTNANMSKLISGATFIVKHPSSSKIDSPDTVRVTFHSTEEQSEVKAYTPGQAYGSLPTPSRSGCQFLGWYPEGIREGTPNAYTPSRTVPGYDHHLYAHWRAKVTFQPGNGSTNSTVNVDFGIGSGKLLITQNPVRSRYIFTGWRNQSTGVLYAVGESMPVTGDVTLTGEWKTIEYTVTHVLNGGDWLYNRDGKSTLDRKDKVVHESNYVVGYIAARIGYKFIGWQYGSRLYLPGDVIYNITGNISMIAQWEELSVQLNFDTDGHRPMEPKTLTYSQVAAAGGSMDLIPSSLVPQPTDGLFAGWLIKNVKEPDENQYVSLPGFKNYDLKATFTKQYFSVSYNANGGDITPASQTKESNVPIILSREIPSRGECDQFVGWSEDRNSSDPEYLPGQKYNVNRDVTLYAIYDINLYCVRYELDEDEYDGPKCQPFGSAHIMGDGVQLSMDIPKRDGYRFVKWRNVSEFGSEFYQPGDTYAEYGSLHLQAVWEKEPEVYVTVTLRDPYNGSQISGQYRAKQGSAYKWDYSQSETNPAVYTFPSDASAADSFRGYFMGYVDGDSRIIHGDEIVTSGQDHTLIARWIEPAPFHDLEGHSYAKEAIAKCYHFGYLSGESAYQYNPSGMVKRCDAALMLSRMVKLPSVGNNWFYDVPTSGSSYTQAISKAVSWAKDWNILLGKSNDLRQFGAEEPIIRQYLVVMLYRFVQSQGMALQSNYDVDLSGYTDVDELSDYAVSAMKWALATKMIAGTSSQTLSPKQEVDRAQMAVFLLRLRRMLIQQGLLEDFVRY